MRAVSRNPFGIIRPTWSVDSFACTPPPPCNPPPHLGDRHFHVFLVNMYCAGLCCPSALRMALHCFPITSNQAPVCVL